MLILVFSPQLMHLISVFSHFQPNEKSPREDVSHPMGRVEMLEKINESDADELSMSDLEKVLMQLQRDAVAIISKSQYQKTPHYHVNIGNVINYLKRTVKHSIAVERYGKMSGRIFELLESNSYLDQQAIGEMSIIPARETRERLYCMYRDKWVDYVEICKRSDFNPASTYYFWYLDKKKLDKALHETLYMSIYKLRCRRVFERSENWSVAESSVQDIDIGNEEANRKRVKFEFALDRIDQGILQTDYTSMILSF
jgi:hypothetical protein